MITITEYPHIKIYWYDEDKTILVAEAEQGWDWDYGRQTIHKINDTVSVWSKVQPVYVILHFSDGAHKLPSSGSALKNIQRLLTDDPSEEVLTIIVAPENIIGNLIKMATRLFKIAGNLSKYRYVSTLELAVETVEKHKNGSV